MFKTFISEWSIKHVTSSPTFAQSNGYIERQIRYIKPIVEKCIRNNQNFRLALLNVRATPIDTKLHSPAGLLLGDPIVTWLPNRHNVGQQHGRDALNDRREAMLKQCGKNGAKHELTPSILGQFVRILSQKNNRWFPGTAISREDSPRSYKLKRSEVTDELPERTVEHAVPATPTAVQPVADPPSANQQRREKKSVFR